mmetsp:Transcript_19807/g.66600  ORF Transcript_19807/g.66600 Transcript_19807/m.66600 type:complete len:91 (+) Transcript_19807:11-283(+)
MAGVFLGALPFSMDDEQALDWLREHCSIPAKAARIIRKRNGWSKGHAIITFDTEELAVKALTQLDGLPGPIPNRPLIAKPWQGPLPPASA